ncbi:molybdenum cofactor guanylyltransferase MobA [Thalassospiraceae bacterium LMO-JJ14]|nr:molybdenum cofactor guanylyltransferase MobA [Thalassospiraceae bacterium LMO-JJ14]
MNAPEATAKPIVGVLLAGGLARRMGGGDKPMRALGGKPILDRVIDRVKPQVHHLILNANGDPARFQQYGLPVVADVIEGHQGPLAGILTALDWAAENVPEADYVVSFATDAPFLPHDLVARLMAPVSAGQTPLSCAISGDRTHPVFAVWPVALRDELRRAMIDEEMRKIDLWTDRIGITHVPFETEPVDPFFNVNRPENLEEAERLLAVEEAAAPEKHEIIPLGVVIERRDSDSRWQDYTYQPVAVFPGAPAKDPHDEWVQLREGDGWVHFHAATMPLELFRGETEGYRVNLSNDPPHIYIVLNPAEEADDPEMLVHLVTACPYEAESYTEDTDQMVEGVVMPPEIAAWVKTFCDTHHKDVPFKKRKRKPYDPRKGDFQQGRRNGGGSG